MDTDLPSTAEPAQNSGFRAFFICPNCGKPSERGSPHYDDLSDSFRCSKNAHDVPTAPLMDGPQATRELDRRRNAEEAAEVRAMLDESKAPKCPRITKAGVRVMRSFDYCHFEVVLSAEETTQFQDGSERYEVLTVEKVDALRKEAARLADKAVAQFKIAKADAQRRSQDEDALDLTEIRAARLREIPVGERTPEQQAQIKAYDDEIFHMERRMERQFDYQDDWDDDPSTGSGQAED